MMSKSLVPFAGATATATAIATLLLTLPAAAGSRRVLATQAAQGSAVRAQVLQIAQQYRIPGVGVLIQEKGQTIVSSGVGDCNIEFHTAVTNACVFHLASASKIFASVAMMTLVQDGKLDLDAKVASILTQLPDAWSTVTVRQIMSHTSGIPDVFSSTRYTSLSDDDRSRLSAEQTIAYAAGLPTQSAPGAKWSYNQTGYVLIGMIVEKLSGNPFANYVQERIFAPAKMTQSTYGDSSVIVPNRSAAAYQFVDGTLKQHFYPYPPVLYPAAGANSSLADLARFFEAVDSGRLLNQAMREQMWAPTRLLDGKSVKYGLGWDLEELRGHAVVEHSGAGSVWLAYMPDRRLTVVFLTNLNGVEHEFEKTLPHGDPILALAERYLAE